MVLVVIKENHFEIHFEGKNIIPFTCACVSCELAGERLYGRAFTLEQALYWFSIVQPNDYRYN